MQKLNTIEQIISLIKDTDLLTLGRLADEKRQELHEGSKTVTFVIDRNVNYTNICSCKCSFCMFHKDLGHKDAYVLEYNIIKEKIQELMLQGGTQLLLQGGLNAELSLDYYVNLIKNIKKDFPTLTIHAFSPSEIDFIAKNNRLSPEALLKEFIKCGLSSIPGGGAEILSDEIRTRLSPNKISSEKWLNIMQTAHGLGLKTTATMVFGFGEKLGHIAEHLLKIKQLQAKTGGFTAFIPWTAVPGQATAHDYLKILAASRLVLDNILNLQVSWVTQGLGVAQSGLHFGANDFGGTMLEENVVKAAGCANNTTIQEIIRHIKAAGCIPAQRNTQYKIIKTFL